MNNQPGLPDQKNRSDQTSPGDVDKEKLLQGITDLITETVELMNDNKKPSFSFTQHEKEMISNIMLDAIRKRAEKEHIEKFESLVPEIVNSIEQIMTMLPALKT